jgi:drug/metabolite transporter (DMT)-like permease
VTPTGVGFGLATALSWGSADFLGGSVSRRSTPLATVVPSQAVALAIAIVVLVVVREPTPPVAALAWAALAGCGAFVALSCLYRALTTGAMGLVASIAAVVGAGLPVIAGAVFGDRLTAADVTGIGLALVAIVLVTRPVGPAVLTREGIILAILSGVGAGCFFIGMGQSADAGGGTWWPIALSHTTCLGLAFVFLAATGGLQWPPRSVVPILTVIGLTDVLGSAFFLLANTQGSLSISAVIASQHPAATAVLARIVTKERLARSQLAGILVALVAIALIAVP